MSMYEDSGAVWTQLFGNPFKLERVGAGLSKYMYIHMYASKLLSLVL